MTAPASTTDAPRTIGGNTTTTPASARPDYERPEFVAGKDARALCHALTLGTQGVKALGEKGLPKWPAEKLKNYKIRAALTQVARYYQRTVQASVGMICATPPALSEDADPLIKADAEDIDGRGTHLEVFARHAATDAINGGFMAILVDAPPIPAGFNLTLADEQALGLRPFWVAVTADRIPSWIVDVPDWTALLRDYATGVLTADQVKSYARQTILRQVVIHEPTDVAQGAFGIASVDRYRVLRLTDFGVTFEVWEKKKADGTAGEHFALVAEGQMLQAGRAPFREIPVAIVYAGRPVAPFQAEPPLLALAELNLDHYQVSADRRYLMRLTHAPTLTLIGIDDEQDGTGAKKEIEVGPNSVIRLPLNGDAKYVAADPAALDSSKEEKDDLVDQMAALGMSFLARGKQSGTETATAAQLDDAAENSTHATTARGLQDGFEQALKFHAMYRGVAAPEITVDTTYASPQVDAQLAAVLWQAVAADKLDVDSWVTYIRTGSLPDDVAIRLDVLKLAAADAMDTELAAQRDPTAIDPAQQGTTPKPSAA